MIVYVESNFILEVALMQEQHESCNNIIELAEKRKINLIIPAYSLVEPFEAIKRHANTRIRFSQDLKKELNQILRSKPYQEEMQAILKVSDLLLKSQEDEKQRLQETILKLINVADIVPLTVDIISRANEYQIKHQFSPQDSLVYASVINHLKSSALKKKCFMNRNSKDFDEPDIVNELEELDCKILFQFSHGYDFLINHLSKAV